MGNRFSSQQDYSQTFQYLVESNQRSLEAAASRVDAKREEEWAARDSLIFTKWQEGKISGNELMAHINARMRSTSYDRAAQDKWREAAIKYGGVIADERAEAAYAESDNINALIAHYAKRLAGTAKGTPERTELAQRLKGLREKRDTDRVALQARKINRQIAKGNMGSKDLLKFYKDQLATGNIKGDLRQDILDKVATLRGKIKDENFQVAMTEIDTLLESGSITPQEAASRKQAVLGKFDIERRDPVGYAEWGQQIQQLNATPDPAEVEELQFKLLNDDITPEQYYNTINRWADRIAPFDLQGSWEMRQEAENFLESEATPLEDGSELGLATTDRGGSRGFTGTVDVVKKLRGNAIKFISQFDGSKYSGTNCGMASGAMLANMMGYPGLSGADLRYLSGDVSGGTNVFQVQQALAQAGVPAGDLEARSNWTFEQFKQKVMGGAPAVLAGWTGDLPPQLNSTSGAMGHAVAIAGYDEKRDAFLVLDPSGDKVWWPSSVVEDFAWGGQGHQGGFNGYALFAPRNTIDPKTLDRVGGKVKHIKVDAAPSIPGATPIRNRTDPGPADRAKAADDAIKVSQMNKERMRDAGIEPGKDLDTKQEAAEFIATREADIAGIRNYIDEWIRLEEAGAYDEEAGGVEMLSTGEIVSPQDIGQMQKELLYLYDGQRILYRAVGDKEGVVTTRANMNEIMEDAAVVNTVHATYATNRVMASLADTLDDIQTTTSPSERDARIAEAIETIGSLAGIEEAQQEQEATHKTELVDGRNVTTRKDGLNDDVQTPTDEMADRVDTVQTPGVQKSMSQWGTIAEILQDGSHETAEDLSAALSEALAEYALFDEGSPQADVLNNFLMAAVEKKALETGEMMNIVSNGVLVPIPAKADLNGNPTPDLSGPDEQELAEYLRANNYNIFNLPPIYIDTPDEGRIPVPGIPEAANYPGIEFLQVQDAAKGKAAKELLKRLGIDLPDAGQFLTDDQIPVSPENIQYLLDSGFVAPAPFEVQRVRYDGKEYWRDVSVDDATGEVVYSWHEGTLPHLNPSVNADGVDTILDHPYRGIEAGADVPWPSVTADPEDMDDSDFGSEVIIPNATPEEKSELLTSLEMAGVIGPARIRDPQNPSVVITPEPGTPGAYDYKKATSVIGNIEQTNAANAQRNDMLVETLPEEEAADVAFWSETEIQLRAQAAGLRKIYRNGKAEYIWATAGAGTDKPPTSEVLESLGITPPTVEEKAKPTIFDPMKAVLDKAMGASKALAAERAAAKEAAQAEKDAAAAAATASPLPKITPAPSTKPNTTLPSGGRTPGYVPKNSPTGRATSPSPSPQPTTRPTKLTPITPHPISQPTPPQPQTGPNTGVPTRNKPTML